MRKAALLLLLVAILVPAPAQSEIDPMRVITEQIVKPEIVIAIDTSGSMSWPPSGSGSGVDCGGPRDGSADLCGDGICQGDERSSCAGSDQDCNITGQGATPGSAYPCSSGITGPTRMFITKRVLQKLLPELRASAHFALCPFYQTNYFQYFKADTAGTPKMVSIFLTRFELEYLHAWDGTNQEPKNSFKLDDGTTPFLPWPQTTVYKLLSHTDVQADATITQDADSLYGCSVDPSLETRARFATAGLSFDDGNCRIWNAATSSWDMGVWRYRGSFYSYPQYPMDTSTSYYETAFRGVQFEDSAGVTWVHRKINEYYYSQNLSWGSAGIITQPISPSTSQADHDRAMFNIMTRINHANQGGLIGRGNTPTGPAIETAHQHLIHRHQGSCSDASVRTTDYTHLGGCPYTAADPGRDCRPRYVLSMTDGEDNSGIRPWVAAENLYKDSTVNVGGANPIKTLAVTLPGLPSSAVARLDAIADAGDDGVWDTAYAAGSTYPVTTGYTPSKTAYFANNEADLVVAIQNALYDMIKGDYTTAAAGVTTSGASSISQDWALVPSVEYPGWEGHLRALDLTQTGQPEQWDAGTLLETRTYSDRKLYTGFPDTNGGSPVPLLDASGNGNLSGGCTDCGPKGVKDVWTALNTAYGVTVPPDAEITATVEWLAGKSRSWKLPPIINSVPAVLGRPPRYHAGDHVQFESVHANRERLIYIASNEGFVHAFASETGVERFAYLMPELLPRAHELWKAGGQHADPQLFKWILANSPRVEDIPGSSSWSTQLVITSGKDSSAMAVLDVTSPSTCSGGTCTLATPPFTILASSRDLAMSSTVGETWAVPAMFYGGTGVNLYGRMAMGSGYYSSGDAGEHYNYFSTLWSAPTTPSPNPHAKSTAVVDYAVLANTAAAIDLDDQRRVVATYQADLEGRIVRYDKGDAAGTAATIISGGNTNPFYFSPAVYHRGSGKVTLAAVSGSQDEANVPSSPTLISTMYMRTETGGSVDATDDNLTCQVQNICSCFDDYPTGGCTAAPSSAAMPVSQPILLENNPGTGARMEAFYLFYDPPTSACGTGSSWLIRFSTAGATQKLEQAKEFPGVRATGMTLAGGGKDILITKVGKGGAKATVEQANSAITGGAATSSPPVIESWREVR